MFRLRLILFACGLIPLYLATPFRISLGSLFVPGLWSADERIFLAQLPPLRPVVNPESTPTPIPTIVPTATPAPVPPLSPDNQRFAFLLLGYGGGGHEGAYLTDSLMVVIVDPRAKSLTLLSLPRDSWVPLLLDGKTPTYSKLNAAYALAKDSSTSRNRLARYTGEHGAGLLAQDTVARLLGIPITYYLGLDFQGFREMIDAVGGIDVEIPEGFTARYPKNDDPSIDASWMIVRFQPGRQHLDGDRAIQFARARETIDNPAEGSDFARSRRQRLILDAFKQRLFEPGALVHLPQLLEIASNHIDTNYSVPGLAQLGQLILDWKSVRIYQSALTGGNYLEEATGPDGAYILRPRLADRSWAQIRAFTRLLWEDPVGANTLATTVLVVENASSTPGRAGQVAERLAQRGYLVIDPMTGPRRAETRLVDRSGGRAAALIARLKQDLGGGPLEVVVVPPDDPESSYLVLELGDDARGIVSHLLGD